MESKKQSDITISEILKFLAPGTPLRAGIDNVLRANTGGLIVLCSKEQISSLVDGGFQINCPFSPNYLYELAKMDGAIILNQEGNKILIANAQLAPDSSIPSSETGMRHRTAERIAKQTGALVIAVSQRRNVITLYKGASRYSLKDIGVILTKANVAVQTLEKYKVVLEQNISNLGILEFEEQVTYNDVLNVMHSIEMILRIKNELLTYLSELGTEGRLIRLQMNELLIEMEREAEFVMMDYSHSKDLSAKAALIKLQELSKGETLEDSVIMKLLGYHGYIHTEEVIHPRGFRVLHKVPRLPPIIIENLIERFQELRHIAAASIEDLDEVEGIGEVRARKINEGLRLIQEQFFAERHL
ncbi:DNA integrity scanning diadenylate cyclase DisA [Cytobacillus horneckiae]|uniref:DNA integrity scanning diadenylate cyclase DisA n=1 Tax=Cytobacillus horneckiae TaxID=549687 RepID=UPI003D9A5E4C